MEELDLVKLTLYTQDLSRTITVLTYAKEAMAAKEVFASLGTDIIHVDGKLNDCDNNKVSLSILKESLGAVEIMSVNKI